jgi:hypothetical protein
VASLNQPRVSQTLAIHRVNERIQPVKRVPFHVAIIQAEGELIHVAVQVLGAGVMIDALHPTFHDCPNGLDTVRVNTAPAVLTSGVSHGVMVEEEATNTGIAGSLIGHELGAYFDVLHNSALQGFLVCVGNRVSDYSAATLTKPYNRRLADRTTASIQLFMFVLVGFLPAKESLINFDNALKFGEFPAASLTKAMQHEPCRLLLDADFLGDLHRRDTFASRHKQVHGIQPLVKGDVRPLEDGSGTNREVKLAFVAAMEASFAGGDAILTGASWAGNAFRPETALKVDSRRFLIGKHLKQFEGADSGATHAAFPRVHCPLPKGLRQHEQTETPVSTRFSRRSAIARNLFCTVSILVAKGA